PALRRLMAEKELGPNDVQASGPAGRILREDVMKAVETRTTPAPEARPAAVARAVSTAPAVPAAVRPPSGKPERVVPMSPLRRTAARRLLEAHQNAAMLTTFNEINMAEVMTLR